MARYFFGLILSCLFLHTANASDKALSSTYLGSREADPSSLVENVSTIHGDYTEVEVDLTVSAPDSLILSRFYSSRDPLETATLGGWRFNPQCFLSVRERARNGKHKQLIAHVGNPDGPILTYIGWQNTERATERTVLEIDVQEEALGIANTAKGSITRSTNLKNNRLYYNFSDESFELLLCSGGKRFYKKHPTKELYLITHEILPSGNKIFYEFDGKTQLTCIKETNASEKKVLAWIKIHYDDGIHIESSDGKTVDYHFEQDPSGASLLTKVTRSDKPSLNYQYQVAGNRALLTRKTLPEGRFIEIEYDPAFKVRSITSPASATLFSYDEGYTEVNGPGNQRTLYRFDEFLQLVEIEHYLNGSLYRVHKKSWDEGNLISTSVENANGEVFYHKRFEYDRESNITEEREYGNLTGASPQPLILNKNGAANQDGQPRNYSYFKGQNTEGFFQGDAMGTGIKYWYKKGTNLLVKKFVLASGSDTEEETQNTGIKKRYFYEYNEDAALVRVVVDNGSSQRIEDLRDVTERTITCISPKQQLPNIGAPEVIEQKYLSSNKKSELLLKKTVNQFDSEGNMVCQSIYDDHLSYRYSLYKKYQNGQVVSETDPLGNETIYTYDANFNLISQSHSGTGTLVEYGYDLRNRLIFTSERDSSGNRLETRVCYDAAGNKLSEIDRFGNETLYDNDDLGRPVRIAHPGSVDGLQATYTYTYDLFDNPISVTDPLGRVISKSYNVHGKPTAIRYLDGTQETFKYYSGGSLHQYTGRDGITQEFRYDDVGRLDFTKYYGRSSKFSGAPFKAIAYFYDAFHKIAENDEMGIRTTCSYDAAGRLELVRKISNDSDYDDEDQDKEVSKVEFIYDALGRTQGVKTWKSSKIFTLEVKEYDLLDRVIEERTEDSKGIVLVKSRYVYNNAGKLAQVIGYPQNKESVLMRYEYDGFGRLCKTTNAAGHCTKIFYDDAYVNEWGQKVQKRTLIDPIGNQTEEIFDAEGRLVKITKKDQFGQLLTHSEACYDHSGNKVLERASVIAAGQPPRTYEMQGSYINDQLQTLGGSGEQTSKFEYNAYGDVVTKYSPGSKEPLTYRYSDSGNLEAISYKEGRENFVHEVRYDLKDNITEIEMDGGPKIIYDFDDLGRLVSEIVEDQFGSYQVDRTYNREDKIRILKLPDGSWIEYIYQGPFVKKAERFSKGKEKLYTYLIAARDQMGNILEEVLPKDLGLRKQTWDEAGRRTAIITDFLKDKVPEGGYDPLENIKKRELTLNHTVNEIDYEYNELSQLTAEDGELQRKYAYDSIGNRLKKNSSSYKVNGLNQLIEAEDTSYTFHPSGTLATKTVNGKTWVYQINPLNQIVSIKDPDQNSITFTYDLTGKRLSKRIESNGKKAQVFRFFYLGDTEIGCINEKGVITELKVPANPNNPEAPAIAIEIKKTTYIPLYDLQGNIACLLDPSERKIAESYHYSAFGEEKILSATGRAMSDSKVENPWRYRGKRMDKEVGLIYFGKRFYDPEIGRWISPDPAGTIDGPNLYAYTHNNPISYVDYFGLSSTPAENCGCIRHDHPGWRYAPEGCVCICAKDGSPEFYRSRKGGDIGSRIRGVSHGVIDFAMHSLHDLQTTALYSGSGELELSLQERAQMIEAVEQSQENRLASTEDWVMDLLSVDSSDAVYQSYRSKTTVGLEIGSLVAGGYGAVKGVISLNRLAKIPKNVSRLNSFKRMASSESSASNVINSLRLKNQLISKEISGGHAFEKHVLNRGEFPGWIRTRTQFAQHIENVLNNPSGMRELRNGRYGYWHQETGTIVIRNPSALDGGTAFQPMEGVNYFETMLR